MLCQVCASPIIDRKTCPKCGFDAAQNYERFPTLFLANNFEPISVRKQVYISSPTPRKKTR